MNVTVGLGTSAEESALLASVPQGLFIGGEWRESSDGSRFDIEDPATGKTLIAVADASPADGLLALDAAIAAQQDWAATAPRLRGELLRAAYERLMEQQDDFALLMTLEMGKPLTEARAEVAYAAEFFRWFGEEAVRIGGRYSVSPDGRTRLLTTRHPVGPTLMITPWNFPLAMGTRKIGPAIAAGCTMVVKPAEQTPLSMLALAQLLSDVGLLRGVLSVVPTTRAGAVMEPLIRDPRARKLTFTGSTPVGRRLTAIAADQVLRVSMELGGNAPLLVFDDADLDVAVEGAFAAKMRNMGEACTAANRIFVHRDVSEEFTRRLAGRMGGLVLGRGTDPASQLGPLIDGAAVSKVEALLADARGAGARVLCGGERHGDEGYFFQPTVVTEVPQHARLGREEIFGPVAAISTFGSEREVVERANATEYGLAAYLFTRDLGRAVRTAEGLEYGMVGVNQGVISNAAAPFGGIKASGLGREGGHEGLDEYLETKYIGLAIDSA